MRRATVTRMPRAEEWAQRICTQLGKTVESILETGRLLTKAKEDLVHGEWSRMFEEGLIPFGQNMATIYMRVASNTVLLNLSNRERVHVLPASIGTLYELTKVPESTLKRALQDGVITPEIKRKAVLALLPARERASNKSVGSETPTHSPSSDLYFRVSNVLSDFDGLSREEQVEFVSLLEQAVNQLRAAINLS